jgi:molybdopterin converting factor subunit 1
MRVDVRYFAILRERVGSDRGCFEVKEGDTVAALWRVIVGAHPQLQPHDASIRFAVNQEYVERSHVLRDGDEVALIPPVSGG